MHLKTDSVFIWHFKSLLDFYLNSEVYVYNCFVMAQNLFGWLFQLFYTCYACSLFLFFLHPTLLFQMCLFPFYLFCYGNIHLTLQMAH